MRTSYNNTMTANLDLMDLPAYRTRRNYAGLPPRPRRSHRSSFGLHTSDLVSMGLVAMTFAATGMMLAGL